jgi:hypothetical protein
MIGLIGPVDSVELFLKVAREMRLDSAMVARSYKTAEEAIELAQELRPLCSVLLFTGRVPFAIAAAAGSGALRTDYIPHEGTDLYRAIAGLLLAPAHRGRLPRLSFDSIDAAQVSEAFQELGLKPPRHIIALHGDSPERVIDLTRIAEDHRRLFEAGEVDVCMTCIGSVHRTLTAAGVPALRITHSRIVIREALVRVRLAMDLSRAEASQVAACVLQSRHGSAGARTGSRRRLLAVIGRKYAEALDGRVVRQSANELVILATRGAVERSLRSDLASRASPVTTELRQHLSVGIGFGASASVAEDHARHAIHASNPEQRLAVHLDEGTVMSLEIFQPIDAREVRAENLRTARLLNVSPTIIRRLGSALAHLDPSSFTATELAAAYGVNPRSARRIVAMLRERNLVEECGIEKSVGAGRPQIAYRIALDRMAAPSVHRNDRET